MPKRNEEQRIRHREYMRRYYQRPHVILKQREHMRRYHQREDVILKRREQRKLYKQTATCKSNNRKWQRGNRNFQRGQALRRKVRLAVIHQKSYISTIHKLIGCDVPTARAHLESQFEDWMSWDNYGQGEGKWCIDHKDAIGNVDLDDEEAVKRVFHYTNMQPMEYCKNCQKGKNNPNPR